MKSVEIKNGKGSADDLYIAEGTEMPQLKTGEVLVKVKAFALNRLDLLQRQGLYPPPPGSSSILGVDYSGVIEKIPEELEGKTDFQKGDRVFGLVTGGTYAEYLAADTHTMIKLPDSLSFVQGAAIPEVWFTATQVVEIVGKFAENESIIFHAGASSVGIAAIQVAQLLGARRIFATVGSDDKCKFLTEKLIIDKSKKDVVVPINYHSTEFTDVVKTYEPNGVNLIIDPVGGTYFNRNIDALGLDGRLVVMGLMSGTKGDLNLASVLGKRLSITGTTLRNRGPIYQSKIRDYFEKNLLPYILNGKLSSFIEKVYPLDQVAEAHKLLESNKTMGKVVVTFD